MRTHLIGLTALALLPAGAALGQTAAAPAVLLDPMFQDHAVVQRDRPVPVWGRATPGQRIEATLAGQSASTVTGPDGRWRINLPAVPAGRGHVLTVGSGGQTAAAVSDIASGDVFLCSGQSNMEFEVRKVTNAETEIAAASDPDLRLLSVARVSLPRPRSEPARVGNWAPTTSDSVKDFSAACYFMGRDLRRVRPDVPVGLISAAWGGSIIEDWFDEASLRALGGRDIPLNVLAAWAENPAEGERQWRQVSESWWRGNDPGTRQGWNGARLDDRDWTPIPAEGFWEATLPGLTTFDGMVWLRVHVNLTRAQARQAATLSIGPVDDVDTTWVNGRFVGGSQGWNTPRTYRIAAGGLKAGDNVIAIGVLDTGGGGGAWGPAADKALVLDDGTRLALDTGWRSRVAAPLADLADPPRTPWIGGSGLTTLFNGMIEPLGPWGLKGAAWYQGESNVGAPDQYAVLLPALMANWRRRFETPDLPFLVVQLADFGPHRGDTARSIWAELREVQRRATRADPRAGLAVAIDIGDPYDIHPTNKQQVGRRLALEARRIAYGDTVAVSPQPGSVGRAGSVLSIAYPAGSALWTQGSDRVIGLQLCDALGICNWADGRLVDGALRIEGPAVSTAARVRYCWADSPVCNLYGSDDLPATPFEVDVP
ncbi:sialate O-acetylesterase [Rhizobium sp. CRIBSB]|nr:sialate O-acetylesterase [Rhizobium sp. CRIBSB]